MFSIAVELSADATAALSFSLKPIAVKTLFETDEMKSKVLTRSYRRLGMNKSTLWYQKKRLEETGSLRIYNKTKR